MDHETKKPRGRKPGEPLVQIMAIKGRPAWRAWLERYANWRKESSSAIVTEAVEKLAKGDGFEEPPPSRTAP